ncbi:MAG TPA: hypothetical protein PK459_06245, partial [Anaerolineaceae bacterium]|nr:hypothetical protein [Anaerolineaceae bacterium]
MKKVLNVLTLFVFLFGAACTAVKEPVAVDSPEADLSLGQESEVQDEEAEEKQPEVGPVTVEPVEEVSIDYAQNFTLEYFEGYKLLTVTQPWIGAEQSFSYALVPEESVGMVDVGNAMVIPTPIKSIITFSTTYYPFLEQIGMLESIVGVDTAMFSYNQDIRNWVEGGMIKEVGGGGSMAPLDVELVVELDADV